MRLADRVQRRLLAAQPHEPRVMMSRRRSRALDHAFTIGVPVTFFLTFTLFPIYWLVNSSLKPAGELFTFPPRYWPEAPTLANYVKAMLETRLGALYLNSAIVATTTCVVLFALARFNFRGRTTLTTLFLLGQVLPHVVMLIPAFVLLRLLGLLDTRASLVLI